MKQYTAENLLIRPEPSPEIPGLVLSITPESAGWKWLSFQVWRLDTGASRAFETGENEWAFVNLGGIYSVTSDKGSWTGIGGRRSPFDGAAHALYLPRRTQCTVTAEQAGEFAIAWCPSDEDHAPWLITPDLVPVSLRGGDHATRQINDLLPPGSPVHRLVLVEVYTPGGNWSSYPPHKHDCHAVDDAGNLLEADLEEIYYYRIEPEEGYALQRVYTDGACPLHREGFPIDAAVAAQNGCAVLVPEGYHPVASPPGYTTYYLNVLAGSAQSLANRDDPRYAWVKDTYRSIDDRVPLY